MQQPGAVVFTTAELAVELRRTGDGGAIGASRAALKHPKMQRTGNKEIVQRSEDNRSDGDGIEMAEDPEPNGNENANNMMALDNAPASVFEAADISRITGLLNGQQQQQQQQPVPMPNYGGQRSRKVLDADEPSANVGVSEYDSYFNFDPEGRIPQLAMAQRFGAGAGGPLTQRAIRSKTNRRIVGEGDRSVTATSAPGVELYDAIGQAPDTSAAQQSAEAAAEAAEAAAAAARPRDYGRVEPHRNTLWDLEIEREMGEAKKAQRGADVDFQTKTGVRRRRRRRRRQVLLQPPRQQRRDEVDFLPTLASTGVLMAPLPKGSTVEPGARNCSSVDFLFVLNVRESETMPPLLLPGDLACVEEKLALEKASYDGE